MRRSAGGGDMKRMDTYRREEDKNMVRRNALIIMVILAMLAVPLAALAQDMPMGKWWHSPKVIQDLSLSREEIGKLDRAYLDNRKNMADFKAKVEKERVELEKMIEAVKLDEAGLAAQLKNLEAARSGLSQERFNFIVETRKILGIDRFKKLRIQYDNARDDMHRMREHMKDRPEGPPRPPAPPNVD
jgi:Spy/CpxP family protein refolding chaperone